MSEEILVWKKDTWGTYGQHDNLYTFVIDLQTLEQRPIFELAKTRYENKDSRKNYHRYTYLPVSELAKLEGKLIKQVFDSASSSRRTVDVKYFIVRNGRLQQLDSQRGLRDEAGFYDEVYLEDKRLIIRKDRIETLQI
jgi:hypothetical protein